MISLHGVGIIVVQMPRFSLLTEVLGMVRLKTVVQENCDDRIRCCGKIDGGILSDLTPREWIDHFVGFGDHNKEHW